MSYVADITEPLIRTLAHTAKLPARQLAGHAANVEFWVAEVKHRFDAVDGYQQRFKKLQQGEKDYDARQRHPASGTGPPLRRGALDSELKDVRRRLADVAYQVLERCYAERLIGTADLDRFGEVLGMDLRPIHHPR